MISIPAIRQHRLTHVVRLRDTVGRKLSGSGLGVITIVVSIAAAVALLASTYGLSSVLGAVAHANAGLVGLAVALGVIIQVLRAKRAKLMLSQDHTVTLGASYGAMVVGHGVGDLIPVVPSGPILRAALTRSLARIPMAFSVGVYMLEGILDGLGPGLLMAYVLVALTLPGSTRFILMAALVQSVLLLLVPILLKTSEHLLPSYRSRHSAMNRLGQLGGEIVRGLEGLMSQGWRVSLPVMGLSLLVTALAAAQLESFLLAFRLSVSVNHLLLLLVLILAAGSLPVKIPGFGTLTTAAAIPLAAVHGPGLAGFVLVSRLVLSSQTSVLAAIVLGWWAIKKNRPCAGLGDMFRMASCNTVPNPNPCSLVTRPPSEAPAVCP